MRLFPHGREICNCSCRGGVAGAFALKEKKMMMDRHQRSCTSVARTSGQENGGMYAGFTYANARREEAHTFRASVSAYSVPREVLTTQVNKFSQRTFKEGLDRLMGKVPFSSPVTVLREVSQGLTLVIDSFETGCLT